MERALQKLANQLNQFDMASLMNLWESYAQKVSRFEPSKRWEEAALIFCMIQAVHWKNQLFNTHMLASRARAEQGRDKQLRDKLRKFPQMPEVIVLPEDGAEPEGGPDAAEETKKRRKVLAFKPRASNRQEKEKK